jgi:DNA-binding NarL/FixJ family response regulator
MSVNSRKHSRAPKHARKSSGNPAPARKERVRIVIADDDPIILDYIANLLETQFNVVGRAGNGTELVESVRRLTPEVVLADIAMPELTGLEAARQITKTLRNVKVVMLSGYNEDALVEASFEAGASGYVVKLRAFTELIPAIQNVLAGKPCCECHARFHR